MPAMRACALRLEAEAMACWMRAGPCASTRPTHAPVSTGKPCTRPVAHSVAAVAVGSALARGQPPISLSDWAHEGELSRGLYGQHAHFLVDRRVCVASRESHHTRPGVGE